jgi:hypothetical protein
MSESNPVSLQEGNVRFSEEDFRTVYTELAEENPFAARAVLKILSVEFTERVPTLAVTLDKRPRLLVNLDFVREHCRRGQQIDEQFVKALICHEFLHVLLRHTERFKKLTPAWHLALDAVINAIIFRELGSGYSDFMARYYENAKGIERLLRKPRRGEAPGGPRYKRKPDFRFTETWTSLYEGRLVADDIEEIARDLADPDLLGERSAQGGAGGGEKGEGPEPSWLGGHDPEYLVPSGAGEEDGAGEAPTAGTLGDGPLPDELVRALDRSLQSMNGSGIWRSPNSRGVGAASYKNLVRAADADLERWKFETRKLLLRYLEPDARGPREKIEETDCTLPVLSTSDRRAALKAGWSPFLPNALWSTAVKRQSGTAQVYLDVSGSMNAEMPLIVGLMHGLRRYIRRPFWAFSDVVAVAKIVDGRLEAETTGGTSMACVLQHVIETRPSSAVVVTDGYIERLDPKLVKLASATRLHALVTRDGDGRHLDAVGISFTQLGKVPQ